ncbi:MAG: hypothetical protein N2Z65_07080 [Clostridiales bacterium]|nr:hypothetical protein [Clostridiales bacterium]
MLTLYTSLTGSQYQSIYSITDDTVIDYIDDDNCAGTTGTSFPKISAVDLAANKGNVYYVEDPDNAGELLYLAIDTTAELD